MYSTALHVVDYCSFVVDLTQISCQIKLTTFTALRSAFSFEEQRKTVRTETFCPNHLLGI